MNARASVASGRGRQGALVALVAVGTLAGAALRFAAARNDLWFDELWALVRAGLVERPLDVVLRDELRHDNNHWLSTLWMHWLGPDATPFAYRAQAWAASVLALPVLAWLGWRRSPITGVLALALAAPSFLLVQYGSEARGYSGAILAGLLGFALVATDAGRGARWRIPCMLGVVSLGIASHLTFACVYLALLVWHPVRLLRTLPLRTAVLRTVLHHALPLALLATLWVTTLRHFVIGGGPKLATGAVVLETLAWTVGTPREQPWPYAAALLVLVIAAAEIGARLRARDDSTLFFVVVALGPALFLALREPEVLYPRYFVVCVPFFLLLFASVLARVWSGPRPARAGALLVLALTGAGNLAADRALLRDGRGQYSAALRFVAAESAPGPVAIAVAGDHDRRLLTHHAAALGPERELVLVHPETAARAPAWVLGSTQDQEFEPPREVALLRERYVLARAFPYAGLSGQRWFLYRRTERAARGVSAPGG